MASRPNLQGVAFEEAFPFYILLDAQGIVHATGPALARALPALRAGEPLLGHMRPSRPKSLLTALDWSGHEGQALVLHGNRPDSLSLRGQICRQDDGLTLLLLAPVMNRFEDLKRHGLQLSDLALHDATGDLLMLQRAAQTSLEDAQRLADRLRQRSQQLQLMSELSNHGIAYFSQEGDLRQCNPLLLSLLGWGASAPTPCKASDVERRLQELAANHDASRVMFDRFADTNEATDALVMQTRDGRHLSLRYRSGEAADHVLFIRDVTRETELDRMKSEFMSTAAHELRTPMTSIFGFSEMLISRELSADKTRSVALTIHKQTAWMVSLLNEVLDLARIEARQADDLQIGEVNFLELLPATIAAYCDASQQSRIELDVPTTLPPIAADGVKAGQALGNVINNAIKYSPAGGPVHVRCGLETRGARHGLRVLVEDHGMGMTQEQLARVFERFYRADPSCNIPGSGLGMSLVQQIMRLHDGAVELSSEKGRGTCATLWFPLA